MSKIKPAIAVAPLKPTQGKQDIYFVCKGTGGGSAGLFVMMQVMFQGGGKPNM